MATLPLFDADCRVGPELPEGFRYQPEFITSGEEAGLIEQLRVLPFAPFEYRGFVGKRRVVEYGYEFDYSDNKTSVATELPEFLCPLREKCAAFASVGAEELVEAVVHEYPAGAPIGWHRDVPQFELVVGVSLASRARMRLKPYKGEGKIVSIMLEPRSVYVMSGAARWKWQHSIPAVEKLRYSITFRTLRKKRRPSG